VGIKIVISLLFLSLNAMASPHGVSAQRAPGVSWKTLARERQPAVLKNFRTSAIGSTVPLPELDLKHIPQLNDYLELEGVFQYIRDIRFLVDPDFVSIQRRSSWMFPDDGCYARASLAIQNIQKRNSITPLKIFAYGNLVAKTANTFEGTVTWWYHVAPIIGAQGNYYVLDPALEPKRPLLLKEWASRLGQSQYISFNLCQPHTYLPYSSCDNPSGTEDENALADQLGFLPLERERILELDRNPDEELGEHPPWVL
jgi:hypothetical protein